MSVGVREMAKNSVANTSPLAERLCQNSTTRRTQRLFTPTITEHQSSRNGVRKPGFRAVEQVPRTSPPGNDSPDAEGCGVHELPSKRERQRRKPARIAPSVPVPTTAQRVTPWTRGLN